MIALPPKFVAFDLETTGLVNQKDEIIEIGAVKFTVETKAGRVVPKLISEFETFVKPNMLIPAEASSVNHITDAMVENAPPVGECLKKFTAFCGQGSILLAHNANFDAGFLRVAYAKNPQLVPGNPVIDSLVMARTILPELENHKLGYMAGMFMKRREIEMKIDSEKMHRAVYDCEMLMEVFVALLRRRLKEKDWEMGSIMASMAKYKGIPQFINK
ncbi:MAG: 3'-5' exoribonuclease [Fibrobacter sp.]|uniref:3'-5' exonuclease n=1 Tax=uncultured Fibrobacter sp. TaxID=261512 RepID=UPI001563C1F5|nr:exonuclease domain-containing protein [uncultured Fibrobacter sp.]MBQ1823514.1 3'-5' exoribonuclease [Fibrobacter sp.]